MKQVNVTRVFIFVHTDKHILSPSDSLFAFHSQKSTIRRQWQRRRRRRRRPDKIDEKKQKHFIQCVLYLCEHVCVSYATIQPFNPFIPVASVGSALMAHFIIVFHFLSSFVLHLWSGRSFVSSLINMKNENEANKKARNLPKMCNRI